MGVEKTKFGVTPDGKEVFLYTLKNSNGMKAVVTDFGAILVNLEVPDKNGVVADVVLGYDKLEDYFVNGCYFGAVIGPSANRIGNASFEIDGVKYNVAVNDGKNNLHSDDEKGYHKRVWNTELGTDRVTFSLSAPDGDMGFPGNIQCSITYVLTEENAIELHYHGESDKNTVLNFTNHTYFNLLGHGSGNIEEHSMKIMADAYTPADSGSIPTGEIVTVEGTPMDFREAKVIGKEIDADFAQLNMAGGYDHNWVLRDYDGNVRQIAEVTAPDNSRTMKVFSDLPGVQFYAGNFVKMHDGKAGAVYDKRGGLCLETQYFPDSVNKPQFPSAVFGPGKKYESTTIYQFI